MDNVYRTFYKSPIGEIEITGTEKDLWSVNFAKGKKRESSSSQAQKTKYGKRSQNIPHPLKECIKQLDEYFKGKRKVFKLMVRLPGTEFQNKVWRALLKVGYGETASYQDIARAVGRPKAMRAVGNTNRLNPVGIIVPCHRIIGSSGKLIGYGGGLWRKQWLLDHERKYSAPKKPA